MGDSSAGPFWARSAIAHLKQSGGRPIWVIRTWWGRLVIIDLERADFLNLSELNEDLARRIVIGWTENTLEGGVDKLEKEGEKPEAASEDRRDWYVVAPVMTAAFHAGWLQGESSVPFLRRMETLGTSCHTLWYGPVRWAAANPAGPILRPPAAGCDAPGTRRRWPAPALGDGARTALDLVLMILMSACCLHQRYFQ
jgi:hypothetical protein